MVEVPIYRADKGTYDDDPRVEPGERYVLYQDHEEIVESLEKQIEFLNYLLTK